MSVVNTETSDWTLRGNARPRRREDHVVKFAARRVDLPVRPSSARVAQRCATLCNAESPPAAELMPRLSCASSPGRRGIAFAVAFRLMALPAPPPKGQRSMYSQHENPPPDAPARPRRGAANEVSLARLPVSSARASRRARFLLVAGNIGSLSTDRNSATRIGILTAVNSIRTATARCLRLAATVGTLAARTTS
jgi:hypothetical protein